ncbi:30S ribosomal protein S7 [Candidatus Dependentiae bacterium]|nr:30S ribosomal protein S7 [Candidatus Dependentiae bacterium]
MPRRRSVDFVREITPDLRFNSATIAKLINVVMERGKKDVARKIVYDAMDVLVKKAGSEEAAHEMFEKVLINVSPTVEVKSRRVGGSVYQVPDEVRPSRSRALAFRWLIESAAKRSDKTMGLRLGAEFLEALENRGGAAKKKADVHRMAEANRAYSHYAW